MKKNSPFLKYILLTGTWCFFTFCSKSSFLDKKPSTNIVVPVTLADFTQLLDNETVMNRCSSGLSIISSGEGYFPTYSAWQSQYGQTQKNAYIWANDIYNGETQIPDWNMPFTAIFYANTVLDGFNVLPATDRNSANGRYVKAWALFDRAYAYYNLVTAFSPAYNEATATSDLGLPIRLTAGIDEIEHRATVQETYDQIIADINNALPLVGDVFPTANKNRVSKVACYALLSRLYLSMRKYDLAEMYADSSFMIYNKLIDYNVISATAVSPFTNYYDEVIYFSYAPSYYGSVVIGSIAKMAFDSVLYKTYDADDLRKAIYFRSSNGLEFVKNGYAYIASVPFTGLATDEMYLIKAECQARRNDEGAMTTLNTLLKFRYKSNSFIPKIASNSTEALSKILLERRKELVWRGLRWTDLKRLNEEGANITLTRNLDGNTYTLPPNDPRYVLPIPDDEISLSGIVQNER